MTDKVQKIRKEVERQMTELIQERKKGFSSDIDDACILELQNVLTFIDSLQEEPVSNELNNFAEEYSFNIPSDIYNLLPKEKQASWIIEIENAIKAGAKWQNNNLWKDVQKELVIEDLEEVAFNYAESCKYDGGEKLLCVEHFKAGAVWQKEQLMKDAIPAELYSDGMFTPLIGVKDKEKLKGIKFGDKVKLIIIKNE